MTLSRVRPGPIIISSSGLTLGLGQPREAITITLPDGSERKGTQWETCPLDVAKEVSKSLSERVVIAKVPFFYFFLFFGANLTD